ncbi:MAG: glycosyltransferase family 39 protein [Lachnospiraceae bacterium]|nr:glycosyltransferase family 39 protein [Lachnospiraceae bacterium]
MKRIKENGKLLICIEYAAAAICGCIFVLICASWTSPLFAQSYGYDSSWYSLMGRAITKGYVPYRDYFDLKGPVFFFIEAIGQAVMTGRNGVFIIECTASAVSSVFIYKTARLRIGRLQSALVLFFYYLVYVSLLWGGNTCEEYMMAFNYVCIYLALKYIKDYEENGEENEKPDPSMPAFFFGITFGIIALSKITVAAPLLAAVITVVYVLLRDKRADLVLKCALIFIGGTAVIAIPVCMYFVFNGAFDDFIYCAFEFAFKRSTDYYEKFSIEWEKNLAICITGLIAGLLLKYDDKKEEHLKIFLILLSVITYAALHLGTPYTYYFITEIAVFVIMLIEGFSYYNRVKSGKDELKKLMLLEGLILLIAFSYAGPARDKLSENLMFLRYPGDVYYEGCIDTYEFIPFYEREEVYNLESGMIYYEINRSLPMNKYSVNLPYFLHLDPQIKENVMAYLTVRKPKWIISEHMAEFDDEDVRDYVFSNYELVRQTSAEEIYRRVE